MDFADILARYFREKGITDWTGTSGGAIEIIKDYPVCSGPKKKTKKRHTIPDQRKMARHLNLHPSFTKIDRERNRNWYVYKGR